MTYFMYNRNMNSLMVMLIAFGGISLGVATAYFYIFARSQERFIQFWGLCWACYSCSLLFLILGNSMDHYIYFSLRKIFDMLNVLFLLYGAYAFTGRRVPGYWSRFSLYLTLWAVLATMYNFDLMSLYIPTSVFQLCITSVLGYNIYRFWDVPPFEKLLAIMVFDLWGYGKAVASILEAMGLILNVNSLYLVEIIFSNVLNFIIFVIYLQRAQVKLETAENRFKLIAENASDVIFFYDLKNSSFSYITPSIKKVLGYSPQDLYSDNHFYLKFIDSDYYPVINRFFDYKKYDHNENTAVIKMFHKNSTVIWAEVSTTVVYEGGLPIALEGVIRNITTMKNAEEQLLSSKKSREVLLSYISHELKTPITSILGYVSALRDKAFERNKEQEALDVIFNKTLTLEHLIYDLFQLSKLETKQFSFNLMLLSGNDLVNELIGKHRLDAAAAGLKLVLKINKAVLNKVSIIADADRLEQVFGNILENAIRFSQKGDPLQIEFNVDKRSENFLFSVNNRGPIITEGDLPYIFDRFYRVSRGETSAKEYTTGLGLTISKEIVRAHKGNITVTSNTRKGTTFCVSIPLFKEKDL